MAHRTTDPKPDTKTLRCPAVEGAQQCVSAKHHKMQNHRWGPKGETDQWHADGRPKDWFAHDADGTLIIGNPDVLPAASPPGGGQPADPAPSAVPDGGDHSVPTTVAVPTPAPAGSGGGGSGRSLVRPDASESVLAALGGVYNPAAEPGYALRIADDFARLIVVGQHFARLVQANADKQPPDPTDVRAVYRKLRQIAATHGIDLDDTGGGR
jgi:hypothetical protein